MPVPLAVFESDVNCFQFDASALFHIIKDALCKKKKEPNAFVRIDYVDELR